MRVHRSLQFLTILATFTACSAPAATPDAAPPAAVAAPMPVAAAPVAEPAPVVALDARWDPRPLDVEYRRERDNMDSRFRVEIKTPRSGESADQRDRRHEGERKSLELRYSRGKASHARGMPPQ
jgi:hypothetical protein